MSLMEKFLNMLAGADLDGPVLPHAPDELQHELQLTPADNSPRPPVANTTKEENAMLKSDQDALATILSDLYAKNAALASGLSVANGRISALETALAAHAASFDVSAVKGYTPLVASESDMQATSTEGATNVPTQAEATNGLAPLSA